MHPKGGNLEYDSCTYNEKCASKALIGNLVWYEHEVVQ